MIRSSCLALAVIWAILTAAGPAAAAPPDREHLAQARKLFDSGQELFAEGRFADAVERFLEAYDLAPLPALLYNAAVAAHRARQISKARELLTRYLKSPPRGAGAQAEVGKARALLAEILRALPGTLEVRTEPAGASVFLETASVGAVGTTPFRTELRAGKHLVLVELEGHAPERRQVEVKAGQITRLELALQRGVGTLLVVVNVRGAIVSVEGQPVGQGPVVSLKVRAGQHQVEVEHPGHSTWRGQATVQPGQSTQVDVSLSRLVARRTSIRPAAWVSLAVGAAAVAAGAGLAVVANQRQGQLERASGEFAGSSLGLQESGKVLSRASIASFSVGGAALVGALTLFLVDRGRRREGGEDSPPASTTGSTTTAARRRWEARPVVGPGLVGGSAEVRF